MVRAIVLMAEGFEEIELCTCVDLLRRAQIDVSVLSIDDKIYQTGAHGISVKADALLQDYNAITDAIILPGGWPGAKNLFESSVVQQLINTYNNENKIVAAICAAPFVLGRMELLKGRKATCYPGFEQDLIGAYHSTNTCEIDGNIITSKGPGYAIEFSLAIIEKLKGYKVANEVKASIF